MRQLFDHSTFIAPINLLMYTFLKVPNQPFIKQTNFQNLHILKANWVIIKEEATSLLQEGHVKSSDKYDDLGFNSFFRKGWKRFYLKWYEGFLPSANHLCLKTVELLSQVPGLNAAMFTFLPAGSNLVLHRDPYAGSLRYHLGLPPLILRRAASLLMGTLIAGAMVRILFLMKHTFILQRIRQMLIVLSYFVTLNVQCDSDLLPS